MTAARVALALVGAALALVLGEGVARLHGDVVCADAPGAFYQADPRLGWTHLPGFAGWVRGCGGDPFPAVAVDVSTKGLLDFERPYERPPGRVRLLVLGGDLPEGLGVRGSQTFARLLEQRADRRRGARLEVINAATGGFGLDDELRYFQAEGVRFGPALVIAVVDPAEHASAPPGVRTAPARPAASSLLARLQLYRLARGIPTRSGPPVAVDAVPVVGADGTRRVLAELRDGVAGAGARLVVVVAPGRGGARLPPDALAGLDVPIHDLGPDFARFTEQGGRSGHLPGGTRWSADGHFIASEAVWRFLLTEGLVPPEVVPARVLGGGRVPEVRDFFPELRETIWRGRHSLFSTFVQYGLLCVCVVWAGAILPAAARDWVLVAASLGLVAALGTPGLAFLTLAFALVYWAAVEWLPGRAAAVGVPALLGVVLLAPVYWLPGRLAGYEGAPREYFSFATNVALLRLAAYAWDRRRTGTLRRAPREFLVAMLFFPTFVNGPIETTEDLAARRPAGGVAPTSRAALRAHLRTSAGALGRLAWGVLKVHSAMLLLNKLDLDVFATGGTAVSHPRLWLWTAELYFHFYIVFSGWTDVTVALGRMSGAVVAENFRAPWASTDVADFWNRWHITFGQWLRRYVYIPLGGNRRHQRLNVLVVFLVSGLWHVWGALKLLGPVAYPPAAWMGFVLWGVLNALGVMAVHWWRRRRGRQAAEPARLPPWREALTFAFVSVAWVPFFLPPWNRIADVVAVFARLVFLR